MAHTKHALQKKPASRKEPAKRVAAPDAEAQRHLRETAEHVKGGLNMLLWWFNPDSGPQHYVNPDAATAEEFATARQRLASVAQWLHHLAEETDSRLRSSSHGLHRMPQAIPPPQAT